MILNINNNSSNNLPDYFAAELTTVLSTTVIG